MHLIYSLIALDKTEYAPNPPHQSNFKISPFTIKLDQVLSQCFADPHLSYLKLKKIVVENECEKGPKAFRKMLFQIFETITEYCCNLIKVGNSEMAILNLTYYQRNICNYLNRFQYLKIILLFSFCNLNMFFETQLPKYLNSASQKITSFQLLEKEKAREKKKVLQVDESSDDLQLQYLKDVALLLQAITCFYHHQIKKSQNILNCLLTKVMEKISSQKQTNRQGQLCSITMYYLHKINQSMNNKDLSEYYFTKSLLYVEKYVENNEFYLSQMKKKRFVKQKGKVKLCRMGKKLEHIELKNQQKKVLKTQSQIGKDKKDKTKQIEKQKKIESELNNLYIIKERSVTLYRLKKDNMKFLVREQKKKKQQIDKKENQIHNLNQKYTSLPKKYKIKQINNQIKYLSNQKELVKQQMRIFKVQQLDNIRQTKVLEKYLKTYIKKFEYERLYQISKILEGRTMTKLRLMIKYMARKWKTKKHQTILKYSRTIIGNKLHFVELIEYKVDQKYEKLQQNQYKIRVFPLEHGKQNQLIEQDIKISQQIFEQLLAKQYYFYYSISNGQLLNWEQQYSALTFKSQYYVHKFITKLKTNLQQKRKGTKMKKVNIQVCFPIQTNQELKQIPTLSISFLVKMYKDISTKNHFTELYTIKHHQYPNPNYNFFISRKESVECLSEQDICLIVKKELMKNWSQFRKQITKIQSVFRMCLSKKRLKENKKRKNVVVKVVSHQTVIVYCLSKVNSSEGEDKWKRYISVQKIIAKQRHKAQINIEINDFQLISNFIKEINPQSTCQRQVKVIIRFLKLKLWLKKLQYQSSPLKRLTQFQSNFRNRIIFTTISHIYIYRGQKIKGTIMFTLSVQSLVQFPRPYTLRIFTLQNSLYSIDIHQTIYNQDKIFYEANLQKLHQIINIISTHDMERYENKREIQKSIEEKRYSNSSDFSSGKSENMIIPKRKKQRSLRKSRLLQRFKRTSSLKVQEIQDLSKWLQNKKDYKISKSKESFQIHNFSSNSNNSQNTYIESNKDKKITQRSQ